MPTACFPYAKPLMIVTMLLAGACASDDDETPSDGAGGAGGCGAPEAPIDAPPIHTPRWAFEPWISKDISDGPDTYAFVKGFKDRDIPVGVVVIDSPWETHYNTFIPNEARYPNFAQMVADMHAQDVRVVLWVTQMVNNWYLDAEEGGDFFPGPSPNFEEGQACGFFINEGQTFTWWKGSGAGVDFFNPRARAWWHGQQNALLDMGINGWKLDFGESYIRTHTVETYDGEKSHQAYSEEYYRDYYAYGALRRGGTDEFVTMARPWDESYDFEGRFFARPEHVPVAWVGDQRRDWFGLSDALDHIFRSASAGYVVVGSDIGGYLDFDDKDPLGAKIPFDIEAFERWVAMGAMTPFMQLHGRTNLTPWSVPGCEGSCVDDVVERYRYWSKLHSALVPFFYSLAQEAYAHDGPMIVPQGEQGSWAGDYRFMLGEAFLVAPILDASGVRDVVLPAGANFYDWWDPAADALPGGSTLVDYDATDRARIPLFVRAGAIVPMHVGDATNSLGTVASAGALTVLVYPDSATSSFLLHDADDQVTEIEAQRTASGARVVLSRSLASTILRIRADAVPSDVRVGGESATEHADRVAFDGAAAGWLSDAENRWVWVKLGPASDVVQVELVL